MIQQVFLFIVGAIITGTATNLLNKYVLKETDPYAFSLLTQIIAAILFLPLALTHFSLPHEPRAWVVLAFASILWSLVSMTTFISYKKTDVSIRCPLSQSRLLLTFLLGIFFLGEALTSHRLLGTLTIFVGICILVYHPEKKFGGLTDPGVRWTFVAAILTALVVIVDKLSLRWFTPEVYGFMVYFFPMCILALFLPQRTHHVHNLFKIRGWSALLTIILSTVSYYFILRSFALADVTLVYPLLQLSTLLTVIGGIIILKEKKHLWQKVIAALIIICGSILLRL